MNHNFLIDTNIIIYYFNGITKDKKIDDILKNSFNISIITKIEFLSWQKLLKNSVLKEKAYEFISYARVYDLNEDIADRTIDIRQNYNIKTPDAIIAATALIYDFKLVTNNTRDFEKLGMNCISVKI